MLIEEIIQRVQSLYSKGVESDDSRLTARHIYNKMTSVRSKLISQQANKKQKINQWNYQTISCIEMIRVEKHDCPCLPPIGCHMWRTKYKLPKPLANLNNHLIQSVTSIEGGMVLSEVMWHQVKYLSGNKYTNIKSAYFIQNEYLYIVSKVSPKVIAITALFQEPLDAINYQTLCKEQCVDCQGCVDIFTQEFPIDADLIEPLIQECVQELVVMFSQIPEDKRNTSSDDKEGQNNRK